MNSRALLLGSLVSICSLSAVVVGCAAPTDAEDAAEGTAESDLSATAQKLAGKYYAQQLPTGGLSRLTLSANGKYTAEVEASGQGAVCITSPCVLAESGTWSTSKSGSHVRLRLKPTGGSARTYDAVKTAAALKLTKGGQTQSLTPLTSTQCIDSADCSASEECAVKVCAKMCIVGAVHCCGPSTCQPKAPPAKHCGGFGGVACGANETCVDDPTDSCDPTQGGADCGGICVPATDPDPAPSGPSCGNATCAAGQVCCNPLMGIGTPPGGFCAM